MTDPPHGSTESCDQLHAFELNMAHDSQIPKTKTNRESQPCNSASENNDKNLKSKNKSSKSMPAEFEVTSWWNSCFRLILKAGSNISRFARSFFRKPVMPFEKRATAVMWPMPLPYPAALKESGGFALSSDEISFHRGVNLVVLLLDWLHLKRPPTCPAEIVLHVPLRRLQWRVVRQIESTMHAWRVAEPVTAFNMGRAAEKVENIERALERLGNFETGIYDLFEETLPENSGSIFGSAARSFFAPGLQSDIGGEVVGHGQSFGGSVAKPIVADRLDFRGQPLFDPKPFLDSKVVSFSMILCLQQKRLRRH